jgi:hypothetical protein
MYIPKILHFYFSIKLIFFLVHGQEGIRTPDRVVRSHIL